MLDWGEDTKVVFALPEDKNFPWFLFLGSFGDGSCCSVSVNTLSRRKRFDNFNREEGGELLLLFFLFLDFLFWNDFLLFALVLYMDNAEELRLVVRDAGVELD